MDADTIRELLAAGETLTVDCKNEKINQDEPAAAVIAW